MEIKKKSDIIKQLTVKEVWKNHENTRIEEQCMSPFIIEHIDDISDITGYDLEVVDREVFVGDFRADIVCKDINTNEIVVIENQLDKSDHEHLGKSFVYLSNLGAKSIVWICETARPEHIKAVENLNEITPDNYNFFMLELKFEKYASDDPFYSFNEVVVPDQSTKISQDIKNTKSENRLHIESVLEDILANISTSIPKAKWNAPSKREWIRIWGNSKCWAGLLVNKTRNALFEIVYDLKSMNKEDGEKYDNFINSLMSALNSKYGYDFKYIVGQTGSIRKIRYTSLLSIDENENEIIDALVNMNNEIEKTKIQ